MGQHLSAVLPESPPEPASLEQAESTSITANRVNQELRMRRAAATFVPTTILVFSAEPGVVLCQSERRLAGPRSAWSSGGDCIALL